MFTSSSARWRSQREARSAPRGGPKPSRSRSSSSLSALGAEDRVALETGNAWEIARLIEPHVARVVVVCPSDTGIRQARAKTDRLDARTLAKLLASGELDAVWVPDRGTWVMRRRLARRGQLVWGRSRAKNQIDPEWRDSDGPTVHKSRSAPGGSSIVGGSGRGGSFGRFCHLSRHVPVAPRAARSLKASSSRVGPKRAALKILRRPGRRLGVVKGRA
jgi:hypothetical protein